MSLLKNTASQVVTFCLVNATDGSALTGATVTTKVTKDGTQAASAGTLTELGSGQYKYVPTQGETNAASVGILFTATNAVPVNLHMFTDDYAARDAAVADAVWDEAVDDHLSTLAFGGQWRDFYSDGLYENFRNVVVPNIAGAAWDEALAGHATAGSAGKKLSDISTGTPLGAADIRAAIGLASANLDTQLDSIPTAAENAAANPALSAAGVRTAVGLASANLDTQLAAIDDAVDTEVAAIYSRLGAPAGASMSADIAAVKAETALIQAKTTNLPAAPASTTNITQATGIDITKILGTAISTPATAGILDVNIVNIGGSAADLGATPGMLDVRLAEVSLGGGTQLRANLGLATADLDTQLAALPTAAEIADANWDEALSGHLTAGTTGKALSDAGAAGTPLDAAGVRTAIGMASANLDTQLGNTYNRIGAPVFGNISGDIAANYAILTNIEDSVGVGVSADVAAIKAKTDNLPADPASSTNVTAVYSRVGAPAGASVSADIAAVKAETATINTATGAAAIRTAVGLAAANLDTQLAAIDDLVDTEVAAIKAKTDYLPSATAGAAGGLFIAGANAATTVDITGNITGNLSGTVGSVTGAVGSVTGAVGSVTGAVGSVAANGITDTSIATDAINAAAVKADAVTKIQNGLATPTNITAAAGIALSAGERTTLANAILDLADGATTNYTLREALEVMLAVLAGKLSGAATATITIRDVNDTKNVVVASVDASGNRTAVTITP